MTVRWLLASLHLLALAIGFAAVWTRGRALQRASESAPLKRALVADVFWGLAALLWISTGLVRAFGGVEKGTDYYLGNTAFLVKMGLLAAVLVLEIVPMTTLIRWRVRLSRGEQLATGNAGTMAVISFVQAGLVVLMVFAATAMARGLW